MFKFWRSKHDNYAADNQSDIVTESTHTINQSDSAPILVNQNFDLSNSVHHDLTRNSEFGILLYKVNCLAKEKSTYF